MARPIQAFKNPVTRPRAIIWTGVGILIFGLVMLASIAITSSVWFCNEVCHHIHDDTTSNFYRSTHTKVSCLACHMPVGTNPVTFMLHKAQKLRELPMAVLNTYHLPLNPDSTLSLNRAEMQSIHCTQCHNLANREVTPSLGIIIDHDVHDEAGLTCTFCHNRVAHNVDGDWEPQLISPGESEPYQKAPNYMHMTACYRCHDLSQDAPASGACATCHTPEFDLVPADHKANDFVARHGKIALEEIAKNKEAVERFEVEEPTAESKVADVKALRETKDEKHSGGHGHFEWPITPVDTVNRCYTCHAQQFCTDCHGGVVMPHPQEFMKNHAESVYANPDSCTRCHGVEAETQFCSSCHHGSESKWTYDTNSAWTGSQHGAAVAQNGVANCTDRCHDLKFCNDCHATLKDVPESHKVAFFTHPAQPSITSFGKTSAQATAGHATAALKSTEVCAVCHGEGGVNAAFCKSCHAIDLPHPTEFRTYHRGQDPKICQNCHGSFEVCSSCHHVGSSQTVKWSTQHGVSVNQNGSASCMDKCHTQESCNSCHQAKKVKPASHKSADFVKKQHAASFKKDATNCTFCHEGNATTMPSTPLCKNCHGIEMPHPRSGGPQGFDHADGIKAGSLNRNNCAKCHVQRFCDSCHHKESVENTPWMNYHPTIVKKSGMTTCEACHTTLACEACHVRLFAR